MRPDDLRAWLIALAADLRSRRVLPLLGVLVLAAFIIPIALSHGGRAAALAPLPPPATTTTAPPISVSTTTSHEPAQNYLTGPAHDPFISHTATTAAAPTSTGAQQLTPPRAGTSSPPVTTTPAVASVSTTPAVARATTSHPSTSTPSAAVHAQTVTVRAPTSTTTVSHTTTVAKPTPYSDYKAKISLLQAGVAGPPWVFHNLARDQLLPSDRGAFIAFLGIRTDKRTAVFLLTSQVQVRGQGRCAPSVAQCTFLELTPGQHATLALSAPDGAVWTFTLRYLKLSRVETSASVVNVDPTGAADVKAATKSVPRLRSIRYTKFAGLLRVRLGSTAAVAR